MKHNFKLIALGLIVSISLSNLMIQAATGEEKRIAASTQNLVEQLTKSGYASVAQQVRVETQGIKTIDAYKKLLQKSVRNISTQGLVPVGYTKSVKSAHKTDCSDEAIALGDSALESTAGFEEQADDLALSRRLISDKAAIARIYTHTLTELNKQ